jgi:transposase
METFDRNSSSIFETPSYRKGTEWRKVDRTWDTTTTPRSAALAATSYRSIVMNSARHPLKIRLLCHEAGVWKRYEDMLQELRFGHQYRFFAPRCRAEILNGENKIRKEKKQSAKVQKAVRDSSFQGIIVKMARYFPEWAWPFSPVREMPNGSPGLHFIGVQTDIITREAGRRNPKLMQF